MSQIFTTTFFVILIDLGTITIFNIYINRFMISERNRFVCVLKILKNYEFISSIVDEK